MRVAILESIVMPAGHEVEFDRILVEELKRQGHEPVFSYRKSFRSRWITTAPSNICQVERSSPMPEREGSKIVAIPDS